MKLDLFLNPGITMRQYILICLLFCFCSGLEAVQWQTNYQGALEQSKSSGKPIVLFFTGSDWCGWCTRLEDESLSTKEFSNAAGDKFIFVKLDYPLYTTIDPKISSQNKELRKKYDIRSFPSLIVIDADGRQMGVTGYRPGGGGEYAKHLLKLVDEFKSYQKNYSDIGKKQIGAVELQNLYKKAKEYQFDNDAVAILKEGMNASETPSPYFLKERYRLLANQGHIHNKEATQLKQQILEQDPANINKSQYDLALIEFEALCDEMDKEKFTPEIALAPLIKYVENYGEQDKENVWRLQMIISQVYMDNNRLPQALMYARNSYNNAPSEVQPEIALAIENIGKLSALTKDAANR